LIGQNKLDGNYFVFLPPTQRQKNPSLQSNTIAYNQMELCEAKPLQAATQLKVCKTVVFYKRTKLYFGSISGLLPFYGFFIIFVF